MIVKEESSACSAVFSIFNSPFVSTNVPREHEVDTGVKIFGVCINLSSHQILMYTGAFSHT